MSKHYLLLTVAAVSYSAQLAVQVVAGDRDFFTFC